MANSINCNGKLLSLRQPIVMGILNITPDSFYDGGKYTTEKAIINRVASMLDEGAKIIDVGGCSSRPNAKLIPEEEELIRITPVVKLLKSEFPNTVFSIDTFRSSVASIAIKEGFSIINDVTFGSIDTEMIKVVSSLKASYIITHNPSANNHCLNPAKQLHAYTFEKVVSFFSSAIKTCWEHNITDIIIDPGFGFSKNLEENYDILKNIKTLPTFFEDRPIMVGLSRKRIIYEALEKTPKNSLNGCSILHTFALMNGVQILRVHDVEEAIECIKLTQYLINS